MIDAPAVRVCGPISEYQLPPCYPVKSRILCKSLGFVAVMLFAFAAALPLAKGESILLDGTDDYVAIGPDTGLETQQFTIETWFKRAFGGISTITPGMDTFPLVSRGAAENFFLGIRTDDRLYGTFRVSSTTRVTVSSGNAVPLNEPFAFIFRY